MAPDAQERPARFPIEKKRLSTSFGRQSGFYRQASGKTVRLRTLHPLVEPLILGQTTIDFPLLGEMGLANSSGRVAASSLLVPQEPFDAFTSLEVVG